MMTPCPRCGFTRHCLCAALTPLASSTEILLLQHERETDKLSNTGKLLTLSLPHCQTLTWSRVNPSPALLTLLDNPDYRVWLVFPADEHHTAVPYQQPSAQRDLFVILDATWQEAKKMVRRSPYLQSLPRLALTPTGQSAYQLRRNQHQGHLCTCEVGAQLVALQHTGNAQELHPDAQALSNRLETFQRVYQHEQQHLTLEAFARPPINREPSR